MTYFTQQQALITVRTFANLHQPKLTVVEQERIAFIAGQAWGSDDVWAVDRWHAHLFNPDEWAGRYRRSSLMNVYGNGRDYPPYRQVPELMSLFYDAYTRCIKGDVLSSEHNPEQVAWQVGAVLRGIHPFLNGNLVLSWLIENQLRIKFGLPITLELRSKVEFDAFRERCLYPQIEAMLM